MDLSLLCSFREGFSNVILESMASGTPVIASNVGGNPEAVFEGKTGSLFNPQDPNDLAAKVTSLLCDNARCDQMSHVARQIALEQFSRKKMIENYEDLYRSLLQSKMPAQKDSDASENGNTDD
jgi:glycosyltransferase involved in cell wall biosynthesis